MMTLLAVLMTFHQLEDAWTREGGSRSLAPTMAAVAIAETHPPGDTHHARMALANYDRHELGGSFCGWQIQRMHTEGYAVGEPGWNRERLLREPSYCAKAAVYVQQHFGLDAWTTHRDGSFLAFIRHETPAPVRTTMPRVTPEQFLAYAHAYHRLPPKDWQPNAFHIVHPRRYAAFIPPPEPSYEVSPGEKLVLGFIAVGMVCYTRRAIRAARDADEAYRRRTRRRRWEGRPLRHREAA